MNLVKLKGKSIWEVIEESSDSGTWKAILSLRNKIRKHIWHELGDGKNTNVWHDTWNEKGPISELVTFKNRYEARMSEQLTVADAIVDGTWIWNNRWSNLANINVPVLMEGKDDIVMWKGVNDRKGEFKLRSVWESVMAYSTSYTQA